MSHHQPERRIVKPYGEDPRALRMTAPESHDLLRQDHDLGFKSAEEHEDECRASWKSSFARAWGPAVDSGPHRNEDAAFNADASFTRWLSPTRQPNRIEGKHSGCRNAWQQEAWAREARGNWHGQNPKHQWYSSVAPLPRLSPLEIQETSRPMENTFSIECRDFHSARERGRPHNVHAAKLWG
mmetsp:Transcript_111947/g.316972  ORF Transcript_111947/g.316972 Transcript_111947/m.316972 type:complete len:183 (+) Transcript_111947:70-618(+)